MKQIDVKKKLTIIDCAKTYGIDRAVEYYSVDSNLIRKWMLIENELISEKDYRLQYKRDYIKRRYANGTLKVKQYKKDYKKHIFKLLVKNVKTNLRKKKYLHECPSALDFWKLALKQKLKCKYSGIPLTRDNISVDHIIPLKNGGMTEINNLCLVDKRVNLMKNTMSVSEFISLCETIFKNSLPYDNI